MYRRLGFTVIALSLAIGGRADAGERYYMLMFGSQRIPPNPNYAHTWTTFVRLSWEGDGPPPNGAKMEVHTISWLPATLKIRTGSLLPEPGVNLDVYGALDFANCTGQRVSMWGPYPICADLYYRAVEQRAHLESGAVRFKPVDTGYPIDRVTNCIHAVSVIAGGPRVRVGSAGWGESASFVVLKKLEPSIISKEPDHWVSSALGLDEYPIIYRDFTNPRSAAILGGVYRALGGERDLQATYGPPVR